MVTKSNKIKILSIFATVPLLAIFFYPTLSSASGPVINQGTTTSYSILAGTSVTNTGATSISGNAGTDVGVITGTIMGAPGGVQHVNDASAIGAENSLTTAYNNASGALPSTAIVADLNGQILTSGAYNTAGGAFLLTGGGSVTFDGQNDPNSVFVIQAGSTFTSSTNSTMNLINGAQACNIFWAVGSSATLAGGSNFFGHLYAQTSITLVTGATVHGNLLARTGSVTLDTNTIVNDNCAPAVAIMPAPVQTSNITSVSPANCVTTGITPIVINGIFSTPVTNITVNNKALASGSWTQTGTTVTVNTVISSAVPSVIQIYNGQAPVLAVQNFTCIPAVVVVPTPTPTPTVPPVVTPGTIHVVKNVVNGYGGTAVASDFTLTLRHHGVDVLGSPDMGMSTPGRTYTLTPGTYVLGEVKNPMFANYISSFNIVGQNTNFINLKSGDNLTIIETNTQLPILSSVVTPPVIVPTVPPVTGGKLPKTGSPWYNMLLFSAGLVLLGGVVALFGRNARNVK